MNRILVQRGTEAPDTFFTADYGTRASAILNIGDADEKKCDEEKGSEDADGDTNSGPNAQSVGGGVSMFVVLV